jgi:multiple sugar transport system ATP-binding protein
MNLLKGTISLGDKPSFVIEGGVSLPLASAPAESDGRPAIYGIRPEHLTLGGTDGVPAEVSVLEPTGLETQVFAKLGTQKIVAVFRKRMTARPGEMLPIMPEVALAHLFDAKTGARLS